MYALAFALALGLFFYFFLEGWRLEMLKQLLLIPAVVTKGICSLRIRSVVH